MNAINKIAVIGTGNMGSPMALNLVRHGFEVYAYDIVTSKLDPLQAEGIVPCSSHRHALEHVDAVLTMLPTGVEVEQVYREEVFVHGKSGMLCIDSSTIDLKDAQNIHHLARESGFDFIDAPVSGGTVGAATGNLTFMVGGSDDALERATPALQVMGAKTAHCGEGGMGQAAKMCNNMMLGIQMASVVEGFHLARKVGLSDEKLFEVATNSSANCFSLTTFCPVSNLVPTSPSNNDFQPGFSTNLMLKDMKIALNAADAAALPLNLAPLAASLYQQFSDDDCGDLDFSAIFQLYGTDTT